MGFWDKILGNKNAKVVPVESGSKALFYSTFGRFTDANKSPSQYEAWDKSVASFEQRDYQPAIDEFLHYIQNPTNNNISKENEIVKIYQGSKCIDILVKNGQFSAQCEVAKTNQLHIGFMRRLLDLNYELKYVRYALSSNDTILLLFETLLQDSSPYKLYFALKELAIHADKQDDLLLHEFDFLTPIHSGVIHQAGTEEKSFKIQYFKSSIQKALHAFDHGKLKMEQYPAAASYIILALLYKMDYLIKPEGKLMDRLEQIHKSYFGNQQKNILQRLKLLRNDLEALLNLSDDELSKDLYNSIFTFGFTSPANINASFELIDRELRNITWYVDNQYDEYTIAILEYATGLSLFNYALPSVIKELFTIVFQVSESSFFYQVKDFKPLSNAQGVPDKNLIKDALSAIEKKYKSEYPTLEMDIKKLNFDSLTKFLLSYILMVRSINFQKAK